MHFVSTSRSRIAIFCSASLWALALTSPANAAGTRAGTVIDNEAKATYDQGGTTVEVPSNINSITIDELLDTVVDWGDAADVPTTPGSTGQALSFTLTNSGNGEEAFALSTISTIGGDDYDPASVTIVIDNGDGVYQAGVDTVYVPGAGNPVLDPDETITVFVVANTPGALADGNRGGVRLVARAATGTGAPGTSFAGAGEGGGDAVVGTTGADGQDEGYFIVGAASVGLAKSATVVDPFNGPTAVPGSTITYQIVATTTGSGSLPNLVITDAIPMGTTYRPNSLRLGGAPLSDGNDGDAGQFSANTVSVALGTVPGGQTRTVTFQVTIN